MVKKSKTYNYDINRKRKWKNKKKLPKIECDELKEAWDNKKSTFKNMREMGLCSDPNLTFPIVQKDVYNEDDYFVKHKRKNYKMTKIGVAQELERQANIALPRRIHLSEPEVMYCTYMHETYGENYKAMAKDVKNYYQDTPKQIKHKIRTFMSIPSQYNKYMNSKNKMEED